MNEQLAIIKDIHIGIRDTNHCICWFTVEILSGGALLILSIEEIQRIIEKHSIYKLEDLNNKPCVVEINNGLVKFKRLQ